MDNFIFQDWLILTITLVVTVAIVLVLRWLLILRTLQNSAEERLPKQLAMLGISIVAIIIIVLALPVSESSRNQLLGLFGVLLSGVIAFSSTTIVSNLMAGLVLRLNKPFRTGDFIRCAGFEGRVSEKGLLDTEIQTRQRALVHIANSFLISNPVEVIRSSGTIISAEVSLGYDIHHALIEKHLQKAAEIAGLSDAFVHITELGNFSVNYKVSGMLEDTKSMLTTESKLYGAILDELHANDIEIMSPNMIAPRAVDPSYHFVAKAKVKATQETVGQEALVFDKAEEAEKIETQRLDLQAKLADYKERLANNSKDETKSDEQKTAEKDKLEAKIASAEAILAKMTAVTQSK